ncbi:hypothetical protein Cylst_3284 [Cylindrospermum stagnale PCC 7417]|uniref:Uncharacterized protein n=1 Tax=Cylindrospermum stagnale PCC 7417 TaxID=56107 RepID=K9X039_9NOST|nr:hypothetical protein [Cylindrospermum stagnale]AFZ25439.1 hypothetical protein Cylst_3284 [Cylindrospermum stagnale PCC 7417]
MAKSKILSLSIAALTLFGLGVAPTCALERRSTSELPIEEFVKETLQFVQIDSNSMNVVWYLPLEVYGAPPQAVLIVAVAKAEIVPPDGFKFASEAEAQRGLKVTYTDSKGASVNLAPAPKSAEVNSFLTEMKPVLSKMAGQFGKGMWFFTFKNVDSSGENIVSPYEAGKLIVSFDEKVGIQKPKAVVELPLNSLFVPALCPNGKPAHISWKYCPWDGTPLPSK